MRYYIQFADRTSRIVSEDEGRKALEAWANGRPVILRGSGYAHHVISAIKTMKGWIEDQAQAGKRVCRYGTVHDWEHRCECRSEGLQLLPPDEQAHVSLPEPMRELPEPDLSQTPKEKAMAGAYKDLKHAYLSGHPKPSEVLAKRAKPDCSNCQGSGNWKFEGTWITCSCITGK